VVHLSGFDPGARRIAWAEFKRLADFRTGLLDPSELKRSRMQLYDRKHTNDLGEINSAFSLDNRQ